MDLDNVIIGAGPYGLSIAAHLRCAGISFGIFGSPLESWRKFMPAGMLLKSEQFASNLWDPRRHFTLQRYCEEQRIPYQPVGRPLSLELFLKYAEWFRQRAVGEIREVNVIGVGSKANGFLLRLADGASVTCRRVILATGHMPYRVIPEELSHIAEPLVLHTTRIGDVGSYAGRDVTIIGAGQSALETAALLCEAGAKVRIIARDSQIEWNSRSVPRSMLSRMLVPDAGIASGWKSVAISELPRVFRWRFDAKKRHRFVANAYGPSGSWWLRDRVIGRVELRLGSALLSADVEGRKVRLAMRGADGPAKIQTDHVIAGTGFRVDIDKLEILEPDLRTTIAREAAGVPALDSAFGSSVRGLFIVGIASAPVFGPIMRFMYGAKHPARVIARRLKAA